MSVRVFRRYSYPFVLIRGLMLVASKSEIGQNKVQQVQKKSTGSFPARSELEIDLGFHSKTLFKFSGPGYFPVL